MFYNKKIGEIHMKKTISLYFLIMFLIGTDTFLVSPLLPLLSHLYHVPTTQSGWIVSAYAIGYVLFAIIAGPISDQRDKKKVLLFGFTGFGLATFLCAFAFNFSFMLIFRFLAGAFAAIAAPQIWASVPRVVKKKEVMKSMGYVGAAISVSQLAGVPIGSFLASISWRTPFLVVSFLSLLVAVVANFLLPNVLPQNQSKQKRNMIKIYHSIINDRVSVAVIIAYFIFQTGNFTVLNFIGTWLEKDFSVSITGVGFAMIFIGFGNLVGTTFGSQLIKQIGAKTSLFLGFGILILLYLSIPFSKSSLWGTAILTLIMMLNGFVFPIFMTLMQSTPIKDKSTMSSLGNAAMYAGSTISGMIGGILITNFPNFQGISGLCILLYLISATLYFKSGSLNLI